MLDRYGQVAADGSYTSDIPSPGRRFFTMLGALVQGRVSLDGAATTGTALALHIALTYANQRRQFDSGAGTEEVVLLDYGKHQRRLLPLLAQNYAQFFSHDELLKKFDSVFSGRTDTSDEREDLETLAAALKPLSTWNALDTIQEAREACGGSGFLAENRMVGLHQDLDVYVTFEGDNNVLLQLVGKRLLSDYAKQFKGKDAATLARFAVGQTAGKLFHGAGLRQLGQAVADLGSTARSVELGLREDQQHELLAGRVQRMVADVAAALRPATKLSPAEAAALFNSHQAELIEAARAHAELLQWEAFTDGVQPRLRRGDQAGADLAARPLRSAPDREAPRVVPHQRPALDAARGIRLPLHRPALARGCGRTRRISSTPTASHPSTCARPSRRVPSASARTRPASTTARSPRRGRRRCRRSRSRRSDRRLAPRTFGACAVRPDARGAPQRGSGRMRRRLRSGGPAAHAALARRRHLDEAVRAHRAHAVGDGRLRDAALGGRPRGRAPRPAGRGQRRRRGRPLDLGAVLRAVEAHVAVVVLRVPVLVRPELAALARLGVGAAREAPRRLARNDVGHEHEGVEGDGVPPVRRSDDLHGVSSLRGPHRPDIPR